MDPLAGLANRVFEREGWARERLAEHARRVFVVLVGPVATGFRIDASGRFESTLLSGGPPDLTLTISPLNVPALAANPARWGEYVSVEGDRALAATLQELAQTLPWFVEQAFSAALGPIIGQRLADAGRRLLAFPEYALSRATESVVGYARDEGKLFAHTDELSQLTEDCAMLDTRADELRTRLDALAARLPGKS